jgi:F-type H+-transporting ATPase subunit epsilon
MAERLLRVEIVSPRAPVWSGTARYVSIPTLGGYIGILPRHQPLLAVLRQGEVHVEGADGAVQRINVDGVTGWVDFDRAAPGEGAPPRPVATGFCSVDSDVVTIVTDEAEVLAAGG